MMRPHIRHFRDLPLIARLLIPFLALMVTVGGLGVWVIVRDLSARGQVQLEQDLSERLLEARSAVRDRELYLVESANFAANVEGIAAQLRDRDRAGVAQLMRSVLALKADLTLLTVTLQDGTGFVEFTRVEDQRAISRSSGTTWSDTSFVRRTLRSRSGAKSSGFVTTGRRPIFAIVAPICTSTAPCVPEGVAIVGIDVALLVRSGLASAADQDPSRGVTIYAEDGTMLAQSGPKIERRLRNIPNTPASQRTRTLDGVEVSTAYAPLEVQGRRTATIAVTVPTAPAFATARGAGVQLALIVVAVMTGVVALGALLSRSILAQVRPLVSTSRALGHGDLSARAVVLGEGELGELARGVNQMAEQLQVIYATLEHRVDERTEEVRRLLKERTEFFASISHELRTPLAAILGQGKMMLDPKYEKNQDWATSSGHMIVETTQQLITVVNEILDLARAEAGRLEMTPEDVDVDEVLKELTPSFEALARSGSVHISMVHPIEKLMLRADRRRLSGIMVNLVDNAVKYTPPGGTVTVSAAARGDQVEFSVADTGVGIPPDAGTLIFEPFYRVKGVAAQGGQASSGLGLALSKRLVEAQAGAMWFTSEPGHGSTFVFTLPRVSGAKRASRSRRRTVAGA